MRPLSVPELLEVWESGMGQSPVDRALTLLGAACPDMSRGNLAALPIGRRDAGLLTLREWTFGPRILSVANCPQCGNKVELSFDVASVRAGADSDPGPEPPIALEFGGYDLRVRPPDSVDVAALAAEPAVEGKRRLLFERCLIEVRREGRPAENSALPAEAMDAVEACLAEADPQADVQLQISCPFCGYGWSAAFDIAAFFWSEIEAWAARILHEVHVLASAYGWNEREVLALSPIRRLFYLEMVGT